MAVKEPPRNKENCLFRDEEKNMNSKMLLKWFSGCQAVNIMLWFLMKYDDDNDDVDDGGDLDHACMKV